MGCCCVLLDLVTTECAIKESKEMRDQESIDMLTSTCKTQ
jgi:hypothetical protein